MPEIRQDPVTQRWVVIATERAKRPESFASRQNEKEKENTTCLAGRRECPFCYGNEVLTPPEVLALRPENTLPNTPGWEVRVVPNKFPAFTKECQLDSTPGKMFVCSAAEGFHEVIISSPDHSKSLAELPLNQVELVIDSYIKRYLQIKEDVRVKYILIIINHGKSAGASLAHPHSQLFAVPVVPSVIEDELTKTRNYMETKGNCVFCDMIKAETAKKTRLVGENRHFISFMPYASRLPFETWILPKVHQADFEILDKEKQKEFAAILKETLAKLDKSLNNPPYNLFIHTCPPSLPDGHRGGRRACPPKPRPSSAVAVQPLRRMERRRASLSQEDFSDSYHWHVEMLPKLTTPAGFEMGTGIMINVVRPKDAAKLLRETKK